MRKEKQMMMKIHVLTTFPLDKLWTFAIAIIILMTIANIFITIILILIIISIVIINPTKTVHFPGANFQKASAFAKTENHSIHHLFKYWNCQSIRYLNNTKTENHSLHHSSNIWIVKTKNHLIGHQICSYIWIDKTKNISIWRLFKYLNCQNNFRTSWTSINDQNSNLNRHSFKFPNFDKEIKIIGGDLSAEYNLTNIMNV